MMDCDVELKASNRFFPFQVAFGLSVSISANEILSQADGI